MVFGMNGLLLLGDRIVAKLVDSVDFVGYREVPAIPHPRDGRRLDVVAQ